MYIPNYTSRRCHAHSLCHIEEIYDTTDKVHTKFLVHKSNDELDEIMCYHEVNINENMEMIFISNRNT